MRQRPAYTTAGLMLCTLLLVPFAPASEFDDYKRSLDQGYDDYREEAQSDELSKEFIAYKRQVDKEFKAFKAEISQQWGERHTVMPSRERSVVYAKGLRQRTVVDFRQGQVDVEVVVDAADRQGKQQALASIQQELQQLVGPQTADGRGSDPRSLYSMQEMKAVLQQGQLLDAQSSSKAALDTQTTTAADGGKRVIYRARMHMVPDHLERRARVFYDDVSQQAARFQLPKALVLSVIETESYFNPLARSSVPAYGLMQLVPTSGARDAYKHVYHRDTVPSSAYLYVPRQNIELGTAFLNKIYYHYFEGIRDRNSRVYCSIAAYNTGASNVLRSFGGKYSSKHGSYAQWKATMVARINGMDAKGVYRQLRSKLPHEETRHYLKNVTSRMDKYINY